MSKLKFSDLWKFSEGIEPCDGYWRSGALDPIGLLLYNPPRQHTDIANAIAFAGTGGDWVTFGFLNDGIHRFRADRPIVMNVPTNPDHPVVIVGENLYDFMCLGCEVGFFNLEQYTYSQDHFFEMYCNPVEYWREADGLYKESLTLGRIQPDSYLQTKRKLLEQLSQEFSLKPWKNIRHRMQCLQDQYLHVVTLSVDYHAL